MELIEVGYTKKPHGVHGELRLQIKDHYLEDFLRSELVFIEHKGSKEPFFIDNVRSEAPFIVKFEDLDSRESVALLSSKAVYLRSTDIFEVKVENPYEHLEYGHCINFIMTDATHGLVGKIVDIQEYPQQEMALVERDGKTILVPLVAAFINAIDANAKTINVMLPEGLLEL